MEEAVRCTNLAGGSTGSGGGGGIIQQSISMRRGSHCDGFDLTKGGRFQGQQRQSGHTTRHTINNASFAMEWKREEETTHPHAIGKSHDTTASLFPRWRGWRLISNRPKNGYPCAPVAGGRPDRGGGSSHATGRMKREPRPVDTLIRWASKMNQHPLEWLIYCQLAFWTPHVNHSIPQSGVLGRTW